MLTTRFEEALLFATRLHAKQVRKATDTPYIAHLMSVTALVLEAGGDEDQAIAALLHDAPEDQGGEAVLDEIRRRFGERVALIVDGCTDTYQTPKPPWRARKEAYLRRLETEPAEIRLVALADKVHNARTIVIALQQDGNSTWERFTGGKTGSLWYYRSLTAIFERTDPGLLSTELSHLTAEMERLTRENGD
jgi:(p)ppGpp synthase/HD superfamily hydrolase